MVKFPTSEYFREPPYVYASVYPEFEKKKEKREERVFERTIIHRCAKRSRRRIRGIKQSTDCYRA